MNRVLRAEFWNEDARKYIEDLEEVIQVAITRLTLMTKGCVDGVQNNGRYLSAISRLSSISSKDCGINIGLRDTMRDIIDRTLSDAKKISALPYEEFVDSYTDDMLRAVKLYIKESK